MRVTLATWACALALGTALLPANSEAAAAPKPAAVVSLADLQAQLMVLQSHIAATAECLQQVKAAVKDKTDLAQAAAAFQTRFKALDKQVELVRTQAVVIKARTLQHYEAWQKDLTAVESAAIREKAQQRFTESKEEFDKIIAKAERTKEEALPFVSELKDISLYLDVDLSAEAVKSLSTTIWRLGNKAKSVSGSIADVIEQIERTIKSLPKK
jgi:hypothetical protein